MEQANDKYKYNIRGRLAKFETSMITQRMGP